MRHQTWRGRCALHALSVAILALPSCSKPKAGDVCKAGDACADATPAVPHDAEAIPTKAGDRCTDDGTTVCATDLPLALRCKDEKLVAVSACRGPRACAAKPDGKHVRCDDSVADVGDPCATQGQIACSRDGAAELACKDGVYTKARACRALCRADEETVRCD